MVVTCCTGIKSFFGIWQQTTFCYNLYLYFNLAKILVFVSSYRFQMHFILHAKNVNRSSWLDELFQSFSTGPIQFLFFNSLIKESSLI